jgi:hypothetical protein
LTVGQAFNLAYERFLETSGGGKDTSAPTQLAQCQRKIQELTLENAALKRKVADLENLLHGKTSSAPHPTSNGGPATADLLSSHSTSDLFNSHSTSHLFNSHSTSDIIDSPHLTSDLFNWRRSTEAAIPEETLTNNVFTEHHEVSTVPYQNGFPRTHSSPSNGSTTVLPLAPPPAVPHRTHGADRPPRPVSAFVRSTTADGVDLFGATPFNVTSPLSAPPTSSTSPLSRTNPFFDRVVASPTSGYVEQPSLNGGGDWLRMLGGPRPPAYDDLIDMQASFSRGLSIATEDFSLDDFDPIKK